MLLLTYQSSERFRVSYATSLLASFLAPSRLFICWTRFSLGLSTSAKLISVKGFVGNLNTPNEGINPELVPCGPGVSPLKIMQHAWSDILIWGGALVYDKEEAA